MRSEHAQHGQTLGKEKTAGGAAVFRRREEWWSG
jgi:hypothetical protein